MARSSSSYYDRYLGYYRGSSDTINFRIGRYGSFTSEVSAVLEEANAIVRSTTMGFQHEAKRILSEVIESNVYSHAFKGYRRGDDGGLKSTGTMHFSSSGINNLKTLTGFKLSADAPPQGWDTIDLDAFMDAKRPFYEEAEERIARELEERINSRLAEIV